MGISRRDPARCLLLGMAVSVALGLALWSVSRESTSLDGRLAAGAGSQARAAAPGLMGSPRSLMLASRSGGVLVGLAAQRGEPVEILVYGEEEQAVSDAVVKVSVDGRIATEGYGRNMRPRLLPARGIGTRRRADGARYLGLACGTTRGGGRPAHPGQPATACRRDARCGEADDARAPLRPHHRNDQRRRNGGQVAVGDPGAGSPRGDELGRRSYGSHRQAALWTSSTVPGSNRHGRARGNRGIPGRVRGRRASWERRSLPGSRSRHCPSSRRSPSRGGSSSTLDRAPGCSGRRCWRLHTSWSSRSPASTSR